LQPVPEKHARGTTDPLTASPVEEWAAPSLPYPQPYGHGLGKSV
jgi:hypothetical protein